MAYVDGFVVAVPNDNKENYITHAKLAAVVFKEHGALRIIESWGDSVPDGEQTSFLKAVNCQENETVVFSTVIWPSKAARETGWEAIIADPRMQPEQNPMPFDGKRLIYGGFEVILDA